MVNFAVLNHEISCWRSQEEACSRIWMANSSTSCSMGVSNSTPERHDIGLSLFSKMNMVHYSSYSGSRDSYERMVRRPLHERCGRKCTRRRRVSTWICDGPRGDDDIFFHRIHKSMNYLHSLIQSEIAAGIRPSRIVLGGFSQGGAIALRTGISLPFPIRGIFSLCGYLPNTPGVVKQAKEENLMSEGVRGNLKVFVGNGTNDPSVKFPWSEWSAQALKLLRFDVDFRSYL